MEPTHLTLSEKERILFLRYKDGLTVLQVAERTGKSVNCVRRFLRREKKNGDQGSVDIDREPKEERGH